METSTSLRNWNEEVKRIEQLGNNTYFKATEETGYEITFQDEGGTEYQRSFEDREIVQIDFTVKVTGGEHKNTTLIWSLTKGGPDSLYGMLAKVFQRNGKASGCTVHVVAHGQGKKRRYVVKEYNDLVFMGGGTKV